MRLSSVVLLACVGLVQAGAPSRPLATWTVKDYLHHRWADELVHFTLDVAHVGSVPVRASARPGRGNASRRHYELMLTDADGRPVPCQFTDVKRDRAQGRLRGTVWTVVTVEPKGQVVLHLRAGKPTAGTALGLKRDGARLTLANDRMAVTLSDWSAARRPSKLVAMGAPLVSVSTPGGKALGQGTWTNAGPALTVNKAATTVVEQGPVRITVRQELTFADGRTYTMTVSLGARQDVALVAEDATVEAPEAGFRFSFKPGLGADRIYWLNNYMPTGSRE